MRSVLNTDCCSIYNQDMCQTHCITWAKILKRTFDPIIALFRNVAIKRQRLHVKFLNCYASLLPSLSFRLICQRLKLPVGFRVITVEVILMNVMLRKRNFGEFSDII